MQFVHPTRRSVPRTAARILAWSAIVVCALAAALAVFVVTFDWNIARPWVDDKVSGALGRPFAINGDLRVGWQRPVDEHGWRAWIPWPRFSAYRVTIGNPPWTKQPQFATVDEITFDVKVLPLLAHRISVPFIKLVNPSIDLERLADGRENWTFPFAQSHEPSRWTLDLFELRFAKGGIVLADALQKLDLQVSLDTLGKPVAIGEVLKQQESLSRASAAQVVGKGGSRELNAPMHAASGAHGTLTAPAAGSAVAASAAPEASGTSALRQAAAPPVPRDAYALGFTAKGDYRGTAVAGSGKIGSVLALSDASRPFPLQVDVKIGDTHLALVGTLTDPRHLAALDLRLWLEGTSPSHLYPILGVPLPDTPPYATAGRLSGHIRSDNTLLTYSGFTGRVGGSDLAGTMTYERRGSRPRLKGNLVSNLLRFEDLAPIVGADTTASRARRGDTVTQPPGRALPVEPFRTDRWHAIDADVTFTGRRIVENPRLPFTDLYAHVVMKDGLLTLEPLRFGFAGGKLASNLSFDGSTVPLKARISMSARHLLLKQLFPSQKTMQSALGELNGDAALSATGNSTAALAATLDGEAKALVTEGKLSRLLMEEAGLNVANIVYEKLFGRRDVNIRCGAADFTATRGVLEARTFALDTEDALFAMNGRIDLRNESMDLRIHPQTKGLRLISLRSPLYVKGTFKNPDIGVSKGALALRAGAAVALGLLNPLAALIPLIAPSHNQPAPCEELVARMREAPSAPPPAPSKLRPATGPAENGRSRLGQAG
ncbi:MAG: AsmA family protein [Paraburkholderia sp.]|nr:AsmA family protein [Paraburkholderia sp.]